ncbi:MAG: hypothetical protein GYA87_07555 [Christensenellaceae bacterium]|nr:hypothetical protein [Christensenellaceae bacterium]
MSNTDEFKYEIINELGKITEKSTGWYKEFNRISFNGREPKYDIRMWKDNRNKMGKGITLSESELRKLKELIDIEIDYLDRKDFSNIEKNQSNVE